MNPAAVADTHAAIWYLFSDLRLSVSAKNAFDEAGSLGRTVLVSAITLAEMVYLVEKKRISQEADNRGYDGSPFDLQCVHHPTLRSLTRRLVRFGMPWLEPNEL